AGQREARPAATRSIGKKRDCSLDTDHQSGERHNRVRPTPAIHKSRSAKCRLMSHRDFRDARIRLNPSGHSDPFTRLAYRPFGHRPHAQSVVSCLHCMNDPQPEGHMASYIGRRKFLATLGGAAAAWPLAARAQQSDRMRRIGVLMNLAADDVEGQQRLAAFLQGLQEAGWEVGRNVRIDIRSTGDIELNSKYAMELLALAPDVFLAAGAPTVRALQKATRTVPIVFTSSADPVGAGLVASLGRPSGNATGFSSFEYSIGGKWLEFLKQIAPTVTRVAVVRDPDVPAGIGQFGAIQAVAPYVGVELRPI